MAATQIALLRGINVGRAKRIAMADLRALVERLGFRDVRTLLNSGNLVFSAGRSTPGTTGTRIEQALLDELGVAVRVTVLSAAELAGVVAGNPLLDVANNHSRLMVSVLATSADTRRLEPLLQQDWQPEALALGTRVAYFWCPAGIIESPVAKAMARALRDDVTTRNWSTMTKLHALAASP